MNKEQRLHNEACQREARLTLEAILPKGSTVYTCLRHVSASGMTRWISVFVGAGKEIRNITWEVGHLLGSSKLTEKNGCRALKVEGCGMDMGYHLIHNLSYELHGYPKDYKADNDRDRAGYTFRHQWL